MKQYGEFSGKWAFASTNSVGPFFYMTSKEFPSDDTDYILPAMASPVLSSSEICTAYKTVGGYYLQMGNKMWLTLYEKLGLIYLTSNIEEARIVKFDLSEGQTELQVQTKSGFKTVYYTVDNPSPILSVNSSSQALKVFQLTQITPPLSQVRANKGCPKGNFIQVNLVGENLSQLNLVETDFTEADLTECSFASTDLSKATMVSTRLTGVDFDNAVLDYTNLSGCNLDKTNWGIPKSAKGLNLSKCMAVMAVLGNKGVPLNCSSSILTGGNFFRAELTAWNLTGAILSGAIFAESNLEGVILDRANVQNTIFKQANIQNASLKNIQAQAANFIGANLDNSDLKEGAFGYPKGNFLFTINGSFSEMLDTYSYPQPSLIIAFEENGVKLSPDAPIQVISESEEWRIGNKVPIYFLALNPTGRIDVFLQDESVCQAAVFTGASCKETRAVGADFYGANLQGVQWHGNNASLDSAILENADFSNALLVGTNFTKARLSGTNFSNSILIGAHMRACIINVGHGKQSTSFQSAMLQGVDFEQATIYSALFTDSKISVAAGVLLFKLPDSAEADLTPDNLQNLAPFFKEAGNPISSSATVTQIKKWVIDNSEDPNTGTSRSYVINDNLQVFDGENMKYLFTLNDSDKQFLELPKVGKQLQAAFKKNGYTIVLNAPIEQFNHWKIETVPPSDFKETVYYPQIQINKGIDQLPVYGTSIVYLANWPQYPVGVAFAATQLNPLQLSSNCIGPGGYPLSLVKDGTIDWEDW